MVESTFLKAIDNLDPVVCFGGANLDFKARGVHSLTLRDSNPVRIYGTLGGVARNIAENLTRLGASVRLISRVGSDSEGSSLLEEMIQLGVEVSGVSRSIRCSTATYTAVLEPEGEMLIGLANMDIYDELTPEVLLSQGIPTQGPFWVVDSNLPEPTLQFLANNLPSQTKLWGVPVSVSKVSRLRSILPQLHGLILNESELSALTGQVTSSREALKSVCQGLLSEGLSTVIVTLGKEGAFLATSGQVRVFTLHSVSTPSDVTGAGDAFAAGVLLGLLGGVQVSEAVYFGFAAAQLALQSQETVNPLLNWTSLLEQAQKISLDF